MSEHICWIERWWVSGTLRPNLPKQVWARSRAMPDRADGAATGLYSRRSRTEAAFTGLRPAPHPVAALGLSVALGRDPAVAPTPHAPAVNRYAGRVTSLEKLYPSVWLTFNALCKQNRGWIEFRQGANNPSPGVPCSLSRKPHACQGLRFSHLWDCETCSHLTGIELNAPNELGKYSKGCSTPRFALTVTQRS